MIYWYYIILFHVSVWVFEFLSWRFELELESGIGVGECCQCENIQFQCCRNRPLRGFATRGEANTPNEVSAEFPIGNWYWYWQHFHNGNIYKCLSWRVELEI